jgi:hypothetical protein
MDQYGKVIGWAEKEPLLSRAEVAGLHDAALRGPHFTSEQVKNMLTALNAEWERTGGFDEEHMQRFLDEHHRKHPPRHFT